MAYRELIYTALTRSRERLVLLIQGNDVADLLALRKPERSDTIRRNSNIFRVAVRDGDTRPYAQHLVNRASNGELLRSKSELFIYSKCLHAGLHPLYESRFDGSDDSWKLPDFTFLDDAGDRIVWEHLGMMNDPDYIEAWQRKKVWYEREGLVAGETLFWTEERGRLDEAEIDKVLSSIKAVVS